MLVSCFGKQTLAATEVAGTLSKRHATPATFAYFA